MVAVHCTSILLLPVKQLMAPLALDNTSEEATPTTHTAMVMISFLHNLHPIASDQTFVLCLLCHLLLVLTWPAVPCNTIMFFWSLSFFLSISLSLLAQHAELQLLVELAVACKFVPVYSCRFWCSSWCRKAREMLMVMMPVCGLPFWVGRHGRKPLSSLTLAKSYSNKG